MKLLGLLGVFTAVKVARILPVFLLFDCAPLVGAPGLHHDLSQSGLGALAHALELRQCQIIRALLPKSQWFYF